MNNKTKSTLTGMFVALSFVTTGGLLGNAPIADQPHASVNTTAYNAQLDVMDASQEAAKKHDLHVRNQLSMPYFSFSHALPKQGL